MPRRTTRPTPPDYLDTDVAGAALGLSPHTIRSYVRAGRLEAVRVGVRFLITKRSVDALLTPSNVGGAK
jgi:excisionase family DNA binding protein